MAGAQAGFGLGMCYLLSIPWLVEDKYLPNGRKVAKQTPVDMYVYGCVVYYGGRYRPHPLLLRLSIFDRTDRVITEHPAEGTGKDKARLPRPGRRGRLACLLQSELWEYPVRVQTDSSPLACLACHFSRRPTGGSRLNQA